MKAEERQKQHQDWLREYLSPLIGGTITFVDAELDDEGWAVWPVINVRSKTGDLFKLEVSQDEEGNGPGFVFGLPHPKPDA